MKNINNRTYNYCTMFDRNYLYMGLALYNSLRKQGKDFKLWILCMDDVADSILKKLDLPGINLVSLSNIENEKLIDVKKNRSAGEYSWTCKAPLISYLFEQFPDIDALCYLDADCYIFSSPDLIFAELEDRSMVIVPHRFSKNGKRNERVGGIYNAGFILFKKDENSFKCLKWWGDKCLEWCSRHYEDGKMGDQLYLNEWPLIFQGVKVTDHKGIDAAPWNIKQYKIMKNDDQLFIDDDPLIFYHFHTLKIYSETSFEINSYPCYLGAYIKKNIYAPYIEELKWAIRTVRQVDSSFKYGFLSRSHILRLIIRIKKIFKMIIFNFYK